MRLQWLGTAGFKVETGGLEFLLDPYLSRNAQARPVQNIKPAELANARQIFISHGHNDHILDVPAIMAGGKAEVYCSEVAAATMARDGVDNKRIKIVVSNGYSADFGAYRAEAFFSSHAKFDLTRRAAGKWRRFVLRLTNPDFRRGKTDFPMGQVLSWRFTLEGRTVHHFGTAGITPEELKRLKAQSTDIMLLAMVGNRRIYDTASEWVRVIKPRLVIPHHHDNFSPPFSKALDIRPFLKKVKENCPGTEVRELQMNETVTL